MAFASRVPGTLSRSICFRCESRIWRQPLQSLALGTSNAVKLASRRRNVAINFSRTYASSSSAASSLLDTHDAPKQQISKEQSPQEPTPVQPESHAKVNGLIEQAQQVGEAILSSSQVPAEKDTLQALKLIEGAAQSLTGDASSLPVLPESSISQSEALLTLQDSTTTPIPQSLALQADVLSTLAHRLMVHPSVFITPMLLKVYTNIQRLLRRPYTFPEVFHLYATKPVPKPNTNPPQFVPQDPVAAKSAVPQEIAVAALNAALPTKNLDLALDIIATTAAAPATRRAKIIKRAVVPLSAIGLFPAALFLGASHFAMTQTMLPTSTAITVLFGGMLTYFGATGTLGYVTITTVNDHMIRVSWAQGVALWERWVREDERAAVDRIVCAWGFKEPDRWGEEEGAMWEELKEWAGVRGMIVDRTELMDGMQ